MKVTSNHNLMINNKIIDDKNNVGLFSNYS